LGFGDSYSATDRPITIVNEAEKLLNASPVGLGTGSARPDRVEHMGGQLESLDSGEARERSIELGFELMGEVHVGHRTTLTTREMVMVADEGFGELEPRELTDARHAMDDAFGLEHREIAIHAARALARGAEDDLVDGERAAGGGEGFDQVSAGPGVATVVVRETGRHGIVQLGRHGASVAPH
jgi:hypothetical protein